MKVDLLLIHNEPPCRKCLQTEKLLREIVAADPDLAQLRVLASDAPEALDFGAVLSPMIAINGKVLCAGIIPARAGIEKILAAELQINTLRVGTESSSHFDESVGWSDARHEEGADP